MEDGSVRRPVTGTPQGGVISPVLCNVYLHRLDRAWRGAYGTLVRYADDLLVLCRSRGQAQAALARLGALLADLGLQPKAAKTRIVDLTQGGEGFDFLGFHIGWCGHGRVAGPAGSSTLPAGLPARQRGTPETASAC
jgi:RNA-directed DNA polymerase